MKGGSCDLVERLAPVALREDLPGLIQQTTGGCARCARRCRPFAIAAIALAGHRRSCSPRGSRLLEGREPGNAPTVEGQDEADDMVADDPLAPVAAITDPRRGRLPHCHPVRESCDEIEQVDTCCRARGTDGNWTRVDRKMLWSPAASSSQQRARVLTDVKARRFAPPPLRGADGLDVGSAHGSSRLALADDAHSYTPYMLWSPACPE